MNIFVIANWCNFNCYNRPKRCLLLVIVANINCLQKWFIQYFYSVC